jgi:hypothetical protein
MTAGYPRRSLNSSTTLIHRLSRCTSPAPLPGRGRSRPRRGFAGERSHLMSPVPLPRRNRTGPPRDRRSGRSVTCSRATGLGKCSEKAGRFRIGRITGKNAPRLWHAFPHHFRDLKHHLGSVCVSGPDLALDGVDAVVQPPVAGVVAPVGPASEGSWPRGSSRKAPVGAPLGQQEAASFDAAVPGNPTLQASGVVNITVSGPCDAIARVVPKVPLAATW